MVHQTRICAALHNRQSRATARLRTSSVGPAALPAAFSSLACSAAFCLSAASCTLWRWRHGCAQPSCPIPPATAIYTTSCQWLQQSSNHALPSPGACLKQTRALGRARSKPGDAGRLARKQRSHAARLACPAPPQAAWQLHDARNTHAIACSTRTSLFFCCYWTCVSPTSRPMCCYAFTLHARFGCKSGCWRLSACATYVRCYLCQAGTRTDRQQLLRRAH